MRRVAYFFGSAAAAGAGTYVVIYLYRWQWQRAILCGVLLLVVEVMLLGIVLLGRLSRIEERMRDADRRQEDVLARLREKEARPAGDRFRWLDEPTSRTYVFVPVLMVTGVLLSGLAWIVQRIASATARPTAERRLAGRLAVLAAPDPARDADPDRMDRMDGMSGVDDLDDLPPIGARGRHGRRTARVLVVSAVGAALIGALVVGLADLTQTREEDAKNSEATSLLLKVDMRGTNMTAERESLAARQLWERCRDSTSVPLSRATLGTLGDGLFAGVVQPALTDHDRMRLRGCLEDTGLDRTHLTVVGIGDADDD
ncbi:hypothetical protein FHS35_004762 [Streptomyces umbrinus]|uniref:hypothetical protein n=1 Tax=Streptomyces umbrinus TaxID=67370 RepID=UPI00167EE11A|nr:hypothetical protein [Streptomyces umbrinus]MCR3727888.1 hypothetical protein [Streptomyces umbrinus]GHH53457.1 hypothetical protein GCM10018775_55240 [Streptomyces umbrinus]